MNGTPNSINRYVIIGILVAGSAIFLIMQSTSEENAGLIAFVLSVTLTTTLAVFAFAVSRRYSPGLLSKIYLPLGLGFSSYVVAELLYYSFDLMFEIEPYPSIADIFFFALYLFIIVFLLLNINSFHMGYTKFQKIWIPAIPIFAATIYIVMFMGVPGAEFNFDFYYGLIFVSGASISLSFTIVGALIFRQGMLGAVWLLLIIGLMLNAMGDIWYYHLEIFGQYYDAHPVTTTWFVANLFIVYALYRHIKIL